MTCLDQSLASKNIWRPKSLISTKCLKKAFSKVTRMRSWKCCSFLFTEICIVPFVSKLGNSILRQQNTLYKSWNAMKQIKMKGISGVWMCFPSLGLRHKDKPKVTLRQHYCIILAAPLEKIYSCMLGRVATICLIIFNIKPYMYFAKRIAMMFCFLFCWLITWCKIISFQKLKKFIQYI